MNLRILYPKRTEDRKLVPTVFESIHEKLDGHELVILDMEQNPPRVIHRNESVNYTFYAGLLPDTFADYYGSLRDSNGRVIFSAVGKTDPDTPYYTKGPSLEGYRVAHG